MSLSLPSTHHLHFPSKPPATFRRRRHRHYPALLSPGTLLLPINPKRLRATASSSETVTSLPPSAIRRIADKLRALGYVEDPPTTTNLSADSLKGSHAGEIFIPNSQSLPKYRVGHTLDSSWSTPENPVPQPGTGSVITKLHRLAGEAKKERKESDRGRGKVPTLAELKLPDREIRRLTTVGIRMTKKLKIGKAGVTEGVVNGIHERWRREEVVKVVCEDVWKLNMKRTHDLLERKTGGMVVWRAGSKIILYRGPNYEFPYFKIKEDGATSTSQNGIVEGGCAQGEDESKMSDEDTVETAGSNRDNVLAQSSLVQGVGSPNKVRFLMPGEKQMMEEADHLLEGLGPRFTDWWGCEPLPIDADLLPAVVPGFRKPFRLLPYGVKPQLTNDELTTLKRLGRPLPCHFALGRNRNHQGLAAAMLKLWEKCEIAKIAVKRGVQNTNSEMMAGELKRLTGGLLLSRDKEYMVFYRGKDFLPSSVSLAIEERRRVRMRRDKQQPEADSLGVLPEDSECELSQFSGEHGTANEPKRTIDSEQRVIKRAAAAYEKTKMKLTMALEKKARAEELLAEMDEREIPQETEIDKEGVTEEERFMLRKVGLKMKPFLLLGRRGVFDGTIENMHLHWKYRELVKIICGGRNLEEIRRVAHILEAESGGILIAVERVRNGHAVIVYRGKNYQRPDHLRPETLLNKKEAMRRSLEAQRRESLKLHVLKLSKNVEDLQLALDNDSCKSGISSENQLVPQSEAVQKSHIIPAAHIRSDASGAASLKSAPFLPTHELEPTIQEKAEDNLELGASSSDGKSDGTSPLFLHTHHLEELTVPKASEGNMKHDASSCNEKSDGKSSPFLPTPESRQRVQEMSGENLRHRSFNGLSKTDGESIEKEAKYSFEKAAKSYDAYEISPAPLSNKERLVLRKRALKMKNCPLLAVGKSNVVAGVAKAIMDHFKKYPLVIVNVKGRAKGTSVQEVIFNLQQATGALLVSQEPSKVILYRGWGAGSMTGGTGSFRDKGLERESSTQPAVSPELLAAMRLECGLSSNLK